MPVRLQTGPIAFGIAMLLLATSAPPARAESGLEVPRPEPLGRFTATIYAADGAALGTTHVESRAGAEGRIHLRSRSEVDGRTVNLVETLLDPIGNGARLRPLWQRARTPDESGELVEIHVDHTSASATCRLPGEPAFEVPLGARDRIANAPMMLLLRPLAAGRAESVRFQMLICQGWVRRVDIEARRSHTLPDGTVEIRYGFDLGPVLSTLLALFLPDIRVWMRPEPPQTWIANKLPLPPDGPDVVMVRDGLDPAPYLAR